MCKLSHSLVCIYALRPAPLKYGQPCDEYSDRCTYASKCIDNVCKCPPGLYLNTTGWCDLMNDEKLISSSSLKVRTSTASSIFFKASTPRTVLSQFNKPKPTVAAESREVHHSLPIYERPYAPDTAATTEDLPKIITTTTTSTTTTTTTTPTLSTSTEQKPVASSPKIVSSPKSGPKIRGRKAGAKCRENDICMFGSSCTNGRCTCPDSHKIKDGRCIKIVFAHPGESCQKGEQCIGGSICDHDSEMCICAARHLIVNGICKSKDGALFVYPGASCAGEQICSGGSTCSSGTCRCDADHYAEDGYCRHISSRSSQVKHEVGGALRFSAKSFQARPLATPCDPEACRLPDCFCTPTGRRSPLKNTPINQVPQFVVLTFDDAVNGRTFPDYKTLFENTQFTNPNGCPIKATFFVSHEWTNYDAVQWLSEKGLELASNSISHISLAGENASRWLNEMEGQKRIIAKYSNSYEENIIGMRAPQLAAGEDEQFEMMSRAGFVYDNTLSANPGVHGEPYWPQTLDYQVPWNCHEEKCPKSSFPGLWEIPLNQFYGMYLDQIDSYRRSSMVRAAVDLNNTVDDLKLMLHRNFNRAYIANKAPYVLSLNADFLQLNGNNTGMKALNGFLQEILENKDIYVVTMKQLVSWMKNPVPVSQMHMSKAVQCSSPETSPNLRRKSSSCMKPNKCMYRTPDLMSIEHQFLTCSPCPEMYPWLQNPIGNTSQ